MHEERIALLQEQPLPHVAFQLERSRCRQRIHRCHASHHSRRSRQWVSRSDLTPVMTDFATRLTDVSSSKKSFSACTSYCFADRAIRVFLSRQRLTDLLTRFF